jgi:hypothetical protein
MHLMIAVIFFFSRNVGLVDVIFVSSLFLFHLADVQNMKYLGFVCAVMIVTMPVSLIVYDQWVIIGNANANYLFFPMLVLWFALALGFIDCTSVVIKRLG